MNDAAPEPSPDTERAAPAGPPPATPATPARRAKGFGSRITRAFVALVIVIVSVAALFNVVATLYQLSLSQDEQAHVLAARVEERLTAIRKELTGLGPAASNDQRQQDAVKLLRQAPAIIEISFLSISGQEEVALSRLGGRPAPSATPLASDPLLDRLPLGTLRTGPVYMQGGTEPRMRMALAQASDTTVATVDLRAVWSVVTQERVGLSGAAFLTDRTGRLLAHPDETWVLRSKDAPLSSLRVLASGGARTPWLATGIDGAAVLRTVADVKGSDWLVVVDLPLPEATRMLQTVLAASVVQLVLGGLLAALLGTWRSRWLLGPVRELQVAAERLGQGDLTARVTLSPDDEIGELGSRFNAMAEEMQAAQLTLENKVAQRTRELSHALEDLRKTQERAIQIERLATLGRLATGVAHELKNPLNFVSNFAGLSAELVDELAGPPPSGAPIDAESAATLDLLKSNLGKVLAHSQRADAVVQKMLQYASRVGDARRQIVSVSNLIRDVLAMMRARWTAQGFSLAVETHFDPRPDLVEAYPLELARSIENVLDNAVYSVRERQRRSGSFAPRIAITTTASDGWLSVSILDNGIGMADDVLSRAFEPFFTTRPAGQGVGLGLSLCEDVVTRLHHGQMSIRSSPEEYCEVLIRLPASPEPERPQH